MSEMVERVARAMCAHDLRLKLESMTPALGERLVDDAWYDYKRTARAAIKAMREPTPEMLMQGRKIGGHHDEHTEALWQAMIDAALEEEQNG